MPNKKRKWVDCMDLASFPDDKPVVEGKPSAGTVVAGAAVLSTWLRCGDGFQMDSMLETSKSSERTSRAKKSFTSLLQSTAEGIPKNKSSSEFTEILWSSSGSDLSDDENKTLTARLPSPKVAKYDLVSKDGEPQFIDWEKDSDNEDDGSKTDDTDLDISDADSCANNCFVHGEEEREKSAKVRHFILTNDIVWVT
uniref:Uncharacterized protein n=1 Tax=Sphaerodactylus townsendi TaxID=933632 RepID=A0ACB8FDK4_9SAUR